MKEISLSVRSASEPEMHLERALTRWFVLQRVGKKESTRHYYKELVKTVRRVWRHNLARAVDDFTAEDMTRFALVAGHYSPTRWNALVAILRATIPAAHLLRRKKVPLPDRRAITQQEFARLIAECVRLKKSRAWLVVNFLAHTGMRITEARRLRWVDVHADRIEAPAATAKNGLRRSIPIVEGLQTILDDLRGTHDGSGFVLPQETVRRGLVKACANAGLPPLTHHDFRHMFTTRCIESGVDLPTVARWLGHQDGGALLAKRYFHLVDEHSRRMAAKVRI